jgi:nucleoside phosphorylase
MKILLLAALDEEIAALKRSGISLSQFEIVQTFMGPREAAKVADEAIKSAKFKGVVVTGFCGGLCAGLKTGQVAVAESIVDFETRELIQLKHTSRLTSTISTSGTTATEVKWITCPRLVETKKEKELINLKFGARAVDMEAFAIAKVTHDHTLPMAAFKVVLDDLETELPNFNDYFDGVKECKNVKPSPQQLIEIYSRRPKISKELNAKLLTASSALERSMANAAPFLTSHWLAAASQSIPEIL